MAGAKSPPVRIALLGCGTVGTGVVKLLRRHAANLERRLGGPLELVGIADRSLEPDRSIGITPALITRDSAELVARPEVDIVVELFGGIEPARKLMLQALAAGKDVVTGNKALPANLRRDIVERTDGIPLFVEEMTKAVLEAESEGAARQTASAVPPSALAVPASLHASLMARLDRLGPAKEVAQMGAAIGREFSHPCWLR